MKWRRGIIGGGPVLPGRLHADAVSHSALLVIFSRKDSVPSTWAATLLTGALVVAAMVQKYNQAITLHHAILTMK